MSARIGDERIATIEISLSQMRVLQCRGYDNSTPKQYDEIIKLINDNMKVLKQTYKKIA